MVDKTEATEVTQENDSEPITLKEKLNNPKEYGGWSKWIYLWILIPIIGLNFGIVGMRSDNEVKKSQGKKLMCLSTLL